MKHLGEVFVHHEVEDQRFRILYRSTYQHIITLLSSEMYIIPENDLASSDFRNIDMSLPLRLSPYSSKIPTA